MRNVLNSKNMLGFISTLPKKSNSNSQAKQRGREMYKNKGDKKRGMGMVIYKALCFDVAQGRMNGAPNETRTHSCRFACLAC